MFIAFLTKTNICDHCLLTRYVLYPRSGLCRRSGIRELHRRNLLFTFSKVKQLLTMWWMHTYPRTVQTVLLSGCLCLTRTDVGGECLSLSCSFLSQSCTVSSAGLCVLCWLSSGCRDALIPLERLQALLMLKETRFWDARRILS